MTTHAEAANVRLSFCLFSIALIFAAGTSGYKIIEDWNWIDSLYMTVITVSTVGLTEVFPLSQAGRIFTIVLILVGVGTMATVFTLLFDMLLQRQVRIIMEKRIMKKKAASMKQHTIVCGYGRMGKNIALNLQRQGCDVVIVEQDKDVANQAEAEGFCVIQQSAAEENALSQASIENARALVAALGSDADNIFLTLSARGMNAGIDIIARAEEEKNAQKFTQAGASRVVSPFAIGASHIVRLLTQPAIVDFVDLVSSQREDQFEVMKIEVTPESSFAGKKLMHANVRQTLGGIVIAIRTPDNHLLFDPRPDQEIQAGDVLFVIGKTQA